MSLKDQFVEILKTHHPGPEFTKPKWDEPSIKSSLDRATASQIADSEAENAQDAKDKLIQSLLKEVVRPAFSKSRSKNVTEQGRKAMEGWRPAVPYDSDAIRASKPWRYEDKWVVYVFEWCLNSLNDTTVEANWPLVIPPVLAHIDDDSSESSIRGCSMLQSLLAVTPGVLLKRTGLGEVFEQALLPHLLQLPPVTDEKESLSVLRAVYPALLKLCQVRFPDLTPFEEKQKSLDRIVRQGIFSGLDQLKDNVEVSRLLMQWLPPFLKELGMLSVKHLKTMIPLVSGRLQDPFATAAPELLKDAAVTMQGILLNAWPRIPYWRLEIIEALTVGWVRIRMEDVVSEPLQAVQAEIREALDILRDIMRNNDVDDGLAQITRILESNEQLSVLLEIWQRPSGPGVESP